MPTRNVNLTEHFDRFIEAGIASGRFSDASAAVERRPTAPGAARSGRPSQARMAARRG